ncbi:PAS domain-containing sensor histidine kinase [Ahrensia marina]|uniref:histidine kinase n=1 Tax=Ahrensia marina TaxID=1514904 RepID=A0A0M9GKY3_9HYPH|nr:PAS domain-containing sensor histidine kinase [Ahrensia marina]KPB00153.1 hypothetical protein SU32_15150 [Ahrensia marina]
MNDKLEKLLETIDLYQVPVFVLSVENREIIRFAGLNQFHQNATGLRQSDVFNKTPHEVFPMRTADTLMRNYMHCVHLDDVYKYEELLDLASGEQWWQTTLSPVMDGDEMVGILGVAFDCTLAKRAEADLAKAVQEVSRINFDLQALTSTTVHDLRGPLRQAKLVLEIIREDFQDLGDNKLQLLETGSDVVDRALDFIDSRLAQVVEKTEVDSNDASVDLGHWCSDIIAIVDPLAKLQISYPEITLECEKFILDIGLRNLIENATKHAKSRIKIEVINTDNTITFFISDDGEGFKEDIFKESNALGANISKDTKSGVGLTTTRSLIESRQGKIWLDEPHLDGKGATIAFSVFGKVLPAQAISTQAISEDATSNAVIAAG